MQESVFVQATEVAGGELTVRPTSGSRRTGAIGYVPLSLLDADALERVRVLRLGEGGEGQLPTDPAYPIQTPSAP